MKTKNFPERRRQRQMSALARLAAKTKAGISNADEILVLGQRTAKPLRDQRTKKNRSATGRMSR